MNNDAVYYGKAANRLNSKGQVAIPACFRAQVSEDDKPFGYAMMRGEGRCLYMYTHRHFSAVKDNARKLAEETGDGDFFRRFMAEIHSVVLDVQGRFVLPSELRQAVGITGPEVLFIGMDKRIELWPPAVYESATRERTRYEEQRKEAARRIFGI